MANAQKVCLVLLLLSTLKTLSALLFTKEYDSAELSAWSDEERPGDRRASARAEQRSARSLGRLFGDEGGAGGGGLAGADMLSLRAIFDMALGVLRALHRGAQVDVERARAADAQRGYLDDKGARPLRA